MAWIGKKKYPATGKEIWIVQFCRVTDDGKERFCASFHSKEDAEKFCDKWEHIFYLKGKAAVDYDQRTHRRRQKYKHKLQNKD